MSKWHVFLHPSAQQAPMTESREKELLIREMDNEGLRLEIKGEGLRDGGLEGEGRDRMEGEGQLERWRLIMYERRGLESFYYTIYTKPKAMFLTCGYRQNLKPHLRNAAPSQTKAAF